MKRNPEEEQYIERLATSMLSNSESLDEYVSLVCEFMYVLLYMARQHPNVTVDQLIRLCLAELALGESAAGSNNGPTAQTA
jgi:hypothetical protein